MRRVLLAVTCACLAWLAASIGLTYAGASHRPAAPDVIEPVNCATFARPIAAYETSKGQSTVDTQSFLHDLAFEGFSVGTISGSIPACVDVLIVLDTAGTTGLSSPYTAAEASSIKSWVDSGHALMLFSDWGTFRAGTQAVFASFGYSLGGPGALTDPNDFDPTGGTDWVVYQSDNFAPHPILEGVNTVEFLRSSWLSPATSAMITSDANSNPSGVPVMAVMTSGAGCAVLSTDSNWVMDAAPTSNAGYFKRDNALMARQSVGWLNGCGRGPIARPGGPYIVNEGSSVMLDGSASSDPNGDPLSFAWDLDNDGQYSDAFVANPTYSAALRDDGAYTVSLRVSDGQYADIGSTYVNVLNAAPRVTLTATATTVIAGTPITFTGAFTDPGVLDTHALRWNFGDGSQSFGLLTRSHTFNAPGSYAVTLTVTDDDGGAGQASRGVVVISLQDFSHRVFLPLTARNFCASETRYADIVLTIDRSGSMQHPTHAGGPTKLDAAKAAATEFLNQLVFPGDQAAIVVFSEGADLLHTLSDDRASLIASLQPLSPGGTTRIDLAIAVSRDELTSPRHRTDNGRFMILLTDGQPNGSDEAAVLDQAARVKALGITIYTVGLGTDVNAALLRQVATTPDRYYFSPSTDELIAIYKRIADTLRCP